MFSAHILTAAELCQRDKRKAITDDDILKAMVNLGFKKLCGRIENIHSQV